MAEKSEQQQFLEGLEVKQDEAFELPADEKKPEEEKDPEVVDDSVKNRRHKRLEAKLQAEREANIAMAERLKVLNETKEARESNDYLKMVERIYGTDSDQAKEATNLLADALKNLEERSTTRALEMLREERAKESIEVKKEESNLDTMVEELEDEYGVTFTPEMERGFFQTLEKLSPKDADGNVIAYADHHEVWDIFQSKLQRKTDTKAKDLAARSMVSSGSTGDSKLQKDATEKWLQENGLI